MFLSSGSEDRLNNTVKNYKQALRAIFDKDIREIGSIQTSKGVSGLPLTTLTPNYLCLQCNATTTASSRIEHGTETAHRFCMISTRDSE
jgi:ubiquitin carboxyl-terminal hydrolase 22/27/51